MAEVNVPKSEMWESIKDKPIEMFGLPNQRVHQYVTVIGEVGGNLYVHIKVSAVLPALETCLAPDYEVELQDKFIVVKPKAKMPQFTMPQFATPTK